MSCVSIAVLAFLVSSAGRHQTEARPFQPLHIPEAISGTTFNLELHPSNKVFWKGSKGTPTFGFNKEKFWGPTLIFNKGDKVTLHMKNSLTEPTTTHWHGLHIPAEMDGGPHQPIGGGKTWSPTFEVMNNAGTYWYHPHAHGTTQNQLTSGAGGLIIIRDKNEAKLKLPRTYGVDDIPLSLTSRRFGLDEKFTFEGDDDKYGDYELVNGVMDPEITLPAQWVRLRILNAEVERGYVLGFSDDRTYYQIATDGGLVDKPVALKRMKLMVGERVEILVRLTENEIGKSVDLMAFNSNQPFGFPGGEPGTAPPNGSYLNDVDFRILHIKVSKATADGVKAIPDVLTKNVFPTVAQVTKERTLSITANNPGEPFGFDDNLFKMDRIDHVVQLGAVEKWTVTNNRIFGHSIHIHDVQFKIVSRSSGPVEEYEKGWKDSVYVPLGESVTLVAKFDDFASDEHAFMYHCHMANHEDGGLMGQFLVSKDPDKALVRFRQKMSHSASEDLMRQLNRLSDSRAPSFLVSDTNGNSLDSESLFVSQPVVLFFVDAECPCAKDATPFMNRLQEKFGAGLQVIGVVFSKQETAQAWVRLAGAKFPVVADANKRLIDAFQAKNAATITLISPGGKIAKSYPGYGQEMLKDISHRIELLLGIEAGPMNISDAPKELTVGCPF